MQKIIKSLEDSILVQFQAYDDLLIEGFYFSDVMSNLNYDTRKYYPIPSEKKRIDYIINAYRSGVILFPNCATKFYKGRNYKIIHSALRYNLVMESIKPEKTQKKNLLIPNLKAGSKQSKRKKTTDKIKTTDLGKRLNLLASKGFKFNESEHQWISGKVKVNQATVLDPHINYSQFSAFLEKLLKAPIKPRAKKYYEQRRRRSSLDNEGFSTDAMDYRIPGSYGSGKKR